MNISELEAAAVRFEDALAAIAKGDLAATDEQQSFLSGVRHGLAAAMGRAELVDPYDLPHAHD